MKKTFWAVDRAIPHGRTDLYVCFCYREEEYKRWSV